MIITGAWCIAQPSMAFAGVFGIPNFVDEGRFSLGLEPELTLTDGAGVGANLKYTHGMSELTNYFGVIGHGSGPRGFRIGGGATFDFFPDLKGQPGIGIAAQGIYFRYGSVGQFEVTAVPYIHNSFVSGNTADEAAEAKEPETSGDAEYYGTSAIEGTVIDPFVAVPFGIGLQSDRVISLWTFVVGTNVRTSPNLSFVAELGIAIHNSVTYFSGGVLYHW